MNLQSINIGALPNDGTGDSLREAFNKVNLNSAQLIAFTSSAADPVTPPTDQTIPVQHLNTATGFRWNWNPAGLAWIPIPKKYVALLTQSGSAAPTAIILENTLGGIPTWSRDEAGHYAMTLAGAFVQTKCGHTVSQPELCNCSVHWQSADVMHVVTYNLVTNSKQDGYLDHTLIHVFVYP